MLLLQERLHAKPSLLHAVVLAFGGPYFALCLLKALNDALTFAGPLLLNLMVRYLSNASGGGGTQSGTQAGSAAPGRAGMSSTMQVWLPLGPLQGAYGCAALLALASVLKAVINSHYNYRLSLVACRWVIRLHPHTHSKTPAWLQATYSSQQHTLTAVLSSGAAQRLLNQSILSVQPDAPTYLQIQTSYNRPHDATAQCMPVQAALWTDGLFVSQSSAGTQWRCHSGCADPDGSRHITSSQPGGVLP